MTENKMFVLGLDGATFDVIMPMVKTGRLPAFARMMREGTWGRLESVPNQRSAAAWTTFQTGTNPGRHGIYEFYDYLPERYSLRFINGQARRGRTLWQHLSRKQRRVGVINVPMTYPAEACDGFIVSGLDCPSLNSKGFAYPEGLAKRIQREVGPYVIEPGITGAIVGGRIEEAVEMVQAELRQKIATASFLAESEPWDCFTLVLRSLDAVQHCFWKYMDHTHPDHDPMPAARFGRVIPDTYELIDRYLGELMRSLDGRIPLMVMSDHGFGQKHPATAQLNAWLNSKGLLQWRRQAGKNGTGLLREVYRRTVGMTTRKTKEWLWATFPRLRDDVQSRLCFANIDWTGTKVYTDSLFPAVRINLAGREGSGIVRPGPEHDRLVSDVASELGDLRDSRTGERIVSAVLRKEDIYNGSCVANAPDLLIRWREDMVISGIRMDASSSGPAAVPSVPGEDPRVISGDHHLHGILLMWGEGICRGKQITGAKIIDLAPTILCAMGLPVPDDMEGRVLAETFTPTFQSSHVHSFEAAVADAHKSETGAYAAEDEAEIRERLRSLGYVE